MKQFMYFFALFIAVVMTACSSKDDFAQDTTPKPIVIKASINGMDTKTRSTGDAAALQNTAFVDGAKINVYLQEYSTLPYPNIPGVPADPGYIIYSYDKSGDTWTATNATGTLYWPTESDLYITGIHPSVDSKGNSITKDATTFTVAQDQTLDDDYKKSDLMYDYNSRERDEDVDFYFQHKLSKITVVVNTAGLIDQTEFNNKVTNVWVRNITRTASLGNYFVATQSGEQNEFVELYLCNERGTEDDIPYNPNGVSCIIPPQTITAGKEFIQITINDDVDFYYKAPAEGLTFQAGKEYIFKINLANKELVLEAPTIGNWSTEEKTGTAE